MAAKIVKEFTVLRDGQKVLHRHATIEDDRNTTSLDLEQLDDDLADLQDKIEAYRAVRDGEDEDEVQGSLVAIAAAIEEIQNDFLLAENVDETDGVDDDFDD